MTSKLFKFGIQFKEVFNKNKKFILKFNCKPVSNYILCIHTYCMLLLWLNFNLFSVQDKSLNLFVWFCGLKRNHFLTAKEHQLRNAVSWKVF